MKQIIITGRLGKDAVLRRTNNGESVLGFSVAVDDGFGSNKTTMWFDCSVWGKRGESLEQYLTKGTKVTVIGDFGLRQHDGKSYPTVNVREVDFSSGQNESQAQNQQQSGRQQHTGGGSFTHDLDDDIPFSMEWRI